MRPALLIAALVSLPAMAEPAEVFGLPVDKVLHASISANLEMGCAAMASRAGVWQPVALLGCAYATVLLGALKEVVFDGLLRRGTPDPIDFAADVFGAGAGLVVAGLVLRW